MSHKYSVHLAWSDDDRAFIATVPELPGCQADGKTQGQALDALDVVVREWIETAKEQGRSVPEPLTVADYELLAKKFHASVEQRIRHEVDTAVGDAVNRVVKQLGYNPMFAGMADPADRWKDCAD